MELSTTSQETSDMELLGKRVNPHAQPKGSLSGMSLCSQTIIILLEWQDLPEDLSKSSQIETDEQSFLELQRYANFQEVLSKRVCNDITKNDIWSSADPSPPFLKQAQKRRVKRRIDSMPMSTTLKDSSPGQQNSTRQRRKVLRDLVSGRGKAERRYIEKSKVKEASTEPGTPKVKSAYLFIN